MHAEALRECGLVKLPFAGYSVVGRQLFEKCRPSNGSAYEIVWDDRRRASYAAEQVARYVDGPQAEQTLEFGHLVNWLSGH